jgi:hypothetical protein
MKSAMVPSGPAFPEASAPPEGAVVGGTGEVQGVSADPPPEDFRRLREGLSTIVDRLGENVSEGIRGTEFPRERLLAIAAKGGDEDAKRELAVGGIRGTKVWDDPANMAMAAFTAYHGTPHKFDKFDVSKVGTGQGAASYGHGLYFAENPKVAGEYMQQLAPKKTTIRISGEKPVIGELTLNKNEREAARTLMPQI